MNKKIIILSTIILIYSAGILKAISRKMEIVNNTEKEAKITVDQPGHMREGKWLPIKFQLPNKGSKKTIINIDQYDDVTVIWEYNGEKRRTKTLPSYKKFPGFPLFPRKIILEKDSYEVNWNRLAMLEGIKSLKQKLPAIKMEVEKKQETIDIPSEMKKHLPYLKKQWHLK